MTRSSRNYLLLSIGLTLAALLFLPQKAHAISSRFPDASNDPSGHIFSIVTTAGNGVTLDAPQTDLQVFIRSSDAVASRSFNIRVVDACRDPGRDIPNVDITVDLRRRNASGVGASILLYPLTNYGGPPFNGCVGNDVVFSGISGTYFTSVPDYGPDYATLIVRINKRNGPGIKAFKLQASGSGPVWSTYAELDPSISINPGQPSQAMNAVWNAIDNNCQNGQRTGSCTANPPTESNTTFTFSPNCSFDDNNGTGGPAYLKWFDADYGASNEVGNPITYWLIEKNRATGAQRVMDIMAGAVLGGNGVFSEKRYNFKVGYDYSWVWLNFDRTNGIQFWMPFSEFNTQLNCKTPVVQRTSPNNSCRQVWGWAIDMDYQQDQLRVQLYADRPRGSGGTLIRNATANLSVPQPGIPNGQLTVPTRVGGVVVDTGPPNQRLRHAFVIDINGLVPVAGRTFYLYTYGVDSLGNEDANPTGPQQFTVPGNSPSCARPPTGDVTARCQYSPSNDFLVTISNVNDPDSPGTPLNVQVRIDGVLQPVPPAPAAFNGDTTDSYPYFDGNVHTVDITVIGIDASGNPDGNNRTDTFTTARGCNINCTSVTAGSPLQPDPPATTIRLTVTINNYGAANLDGTNNLRVYVRHPAGHPAPYNAYLPAPLDGSQLLSTTPTTIPPNSNGTYTNSSFTTAGRPMGVYNVSVNFRGTDYPCGSFVIGYQPYIRAYGGEVISGTNDGQTDDNTVATTCRGWGVRRDSSAPDINDNTRSGIYGFPGSGPINRSATQLGVLSLGEIHNFSSSVLNGGAPTNRLTFANTGTGIPPEGQLGINRCPYDYWGSAQPTTTATTVGASPALDSLSGNALDRYYHNGPVTLGSQTINGKSAACGRPKTVNLYVRGNVTITGDIVYQNGTCAGVSRVPRLQVVATGSINIAFNVTRLDGIFIAQDYNRSGDSSGTIYTCTNANGTRIDEAYRNPGLPYLYATCNNQLTVNGSLIATRIKWLRTYGTLRESAGANEYPGSPTLASCPSSSDNRPPGTRTINVPSVQSSCASEIINLTPEAYLVQEPTDTNIINTKFDVITALPPLL